MRAVFTSVSLFLPFLDLFAALCGNGMLESMLEPHLKFAGASTVDVGISFLVFGCCYMFGNLLFGSVICFDYNFRYLDRFWQDMHCKRTICCLIFDDLSFVDVLQSFENLFLLISVPTQAAIYK